MAGLRTISSCEVCGGLELVPLLNLGDQPMCDDLVPIGSDRAAPAYPLRLVGCPRCITVHQAVQVEKRLLFPQSYHYRAAMTQDVVQGMRDLVETLERRLGDLAGRAILDIGCNDGTLLSLFREKGAKTAGIEPTGAAAEARRRADWIYQGFFDAEAVEAYRASHPQPDIITFTNVFAHIEDLQGLLANLRCLLGPATKLVIETHYLGAVVDRGQFDTFYHEHPRTYSFRSFDFVAAKLERAIEHVDFPQRYNGNIRVVIGGGAAAPRPARDEGGLLEGVVEMQTAIAEARERMRGCLATLAAKHGPLPAKAFPGRAAILIHCFDIDERLVDAAYERPASPKVGHYIPGTRIEIRDETEFFRTRLDAPVLVNLAWHIAAEIESYMRGKGYGGEIIPIFQ